MFVTILIIAVRTAITVLFGVFIGSKLTKKYEPKLYTLVIEIYNTDLQESRYEVKKFVSATKRNEFEDYHMLSMISFGFNQDVGTSRLISSDNNIYIAYHKID